MARCRLLVTATETEARLAAENLELDAVPSEAVGSGCILRRSEDGSVVLAATGVGPVCAERGLLNVLARVRPVACVVGFGFAGGLTKAACRGDLVIPSKVLRKSETETPTDWLRMSLLSCLQTRPLQSLVTVDDRVGSRTDKAALYAATGAETVDRESAAWGAVCRGEGIPWVIARVVLDQAEDEMPLSVVFAARRFLLHPSELFAARRVKVWSKEAMARLGGFLAEWMRTRPA